MRIALACALAMCVACGEVSQGGFSPTLDERTGTVIPQATTWTGISVDAYRYGTVDRTGTVPQATTMIGIGVDPFRYDTTVAK